MIPHPIHLPHEPNRKLRFASALALVCFGALFTGCVSSKYKPASKKTPPPTELNVGFTHAPFESTLKTVITYNGPGSWKRNAFWDEFVLTLHNTSDRPLVITAATVQDQTGHALAAGAQPWVLEKQSKTQEQRYKEAGISFVRYTTPAVLLSSLGYAAAISGGMMVGPASAGAATLASATVLALPIYYLAVASVNYDNKKHMTSEFNRRNLVLPLTLAPGEKRSGSFFFPVTASPRQLSLRGAAVGAEPIESTLPLNFLAGLHVKAPVVAAK